MAIPPWTIELLRRSLGDVARKASEPETIEKLKTQAVEILQDLPNTAARGIDAVMRSAEAGKKSVERWSRKQTALAVPMLNASGVLHCDLGRGNFGTGVPLAGVAVDAGYELLRGDVIVGEAARERLNKRLRRLLPASGEHSVLIASSFPAALTAFSMLVEQRSLVVHRSHAVQLPGGLPLPDAFGTLLPIVQEVGSVGRVQASDFDAFEAFCAILADDGQTPVELLDLGDRDAMQAVVLPVATFAASDDDSIPSAEAMLTGGADFVLMPGDGICGGPPCGILIGRQEAIEGIAASAAWPALVADTARHAMITVALEAAASSPDQIPVRALLNTSEQNLRGRAERMATRLSGSDSIAHCQVTADDARITSEGRWRFPSRQIRLRHNSMAASAWLSKLQEELPAVIADVVDDELKVDLRWIAAADDGKLAELLGGVSWPDKANDGGEIADVQ